jgi:putative membrane protein
MILALLHSGELVAPHDIWTAWSFEPGVVLLLIATIALHSRGMRRVSSLSTRNKTGIKRESVLFVSGCGVLAFALLSPIHRLGGSLFSAHMVQHELLMAIAAPLLVLGRPVVPMLWGLPASLRRRLGLFFTRGIPSEVWSGISNPYSAWMLHAIAIWIWHAPGLYDASVRSELVHTAQHLSFFLTALLFWWSVLSPESQRKRGGVGVISLFTTGIHTTLLGALITTAGTPLYTAYTASGTAAWSLTRLTDQQLGGIVMWIPAGVVYLAAALWLFQKWLSESGARVRRAEVARKNITANMAGTTAVLLFAMLIVGCGGMSEQEAGELTGGNAHRGVDAMRKYGCQSCHTIPGITGANKLVGPPLGGIASRSYIAGVMVNSPDNMITWLRNPPAVDNKTAMPNLGVTEKDARDISAYLYTLR